MPKRLIQQRRGRATPKYIANKGSFKNQYIFDYTLDLLTGEIIDIVNNPGKTAPISVIKLSNDRLFYISASEGSSFKI